LQNQNIVLHLLINQSHIFYLLTKSNKMTTTLIAAKINTKSNYQNLNGTFQQVHQMIGNRVTCLVEIDGKLLKVDFILSEISEFRYNAQ